MGEERARYRRPLKFVPGVGKAVRTLSADVQDVFGKALMDAFRAVERAVVELLPGDATAKLEGSGEL